MPHQLGYIVIYTKRTQEMIDFYSRYFGYTAHQRPDDRIVELRPQGLGTMLLLHPASKGQKEGQSLVKFVFDVENVEEFCRRAGETGLAFGPIHKGDGYTFANTKDPSNNSVSVSSRAFAPNAA